MECDDRVRWYHVNTELDPWFGNVRKISNQLSNYQRFENFRTMETITVEENDWWHRICYRDCVSGLQLRSLSARMSMPCANTTLSREHVYEYRDYFLYNLSLNVEDTDTVPSNYVLSQISGKLWQVINKYMCIQFWTNEWIILKIVMNGMP
jgi:hypothetical protein